MKTTRTKNLILLFMMLFAVSPSHTRAAVFSPKNTTIFFSICSGVLGAYGVYSAAYCLKCCWNSSYDQMDDSGTQQQPSQSVEAFKRARGDAAFCLGFSALFAAVAVVASSNK